MELEIRTRKLKDKVKKLKTKIVTVFKKKTKKTAGVGNHRPNKQDYRQIQDETPSLFYTL